jgi:hypothetical protein
MLQLIIFAVLVATPDQQLLTEGQRWKVQSITTGQLNTELQKAAIAHAEYQAEKHKQGHQDWEKRVQVLRKLLPQCHTFAEVANESWPGQDQQAAAYEMYRSWKLSPGHWSAVNGKCRYYGYALRRGDNGVWYACGIFAE